MHQLRSFGLVVLFAAAVGLTVGCGPSNPTKTADPKGAGRAVPVPLLDLLAQLPKDCWPKDEKDTLQFAKARKWYNKNAAGRRVTLKLPKGDHLKFELDKKSGMYTVKFTGGFGTVKLFEREWRLWIQVYVPKDGSYFLTLRATGLTEAAAERLRAMPADQLLEFVLTFEDFVDDPYVKVLVTDDVAIKGFSE